MAGAAQAKTRAEFTGERSHHPGGNTKQAHVAVVLLEEEAVLFFGELLRATTRTDDHAETASSLEGQGSVVDSSRSQSFASSGQSQGKHAAHVLTVALLNPCKLIKIRDLAGNLYRDLRWIKAGDAMHSTGAGENGFRESLRADAVWTDGSHPGNHDATIHPLPR